MKRSCQIQLVKIFLLVGSLLFTFLFVVAGSGNYSFGDPIYWMRLCRDDNDFYMTKGAVALGHVWMSLVGDTVFSTRLLSWICVSVAIALPYVCLLTKCERKGNIHWLGMAFFLSGYGAFQEYSPGALSILLVSTVAVLWAKYLVNRRYLIIVVICTSLAIVSRFPNVILVMMLSFLIIAHGIVMKQDLKKTILDVLILVVGSISFALCMYSLLGCDMSFEGFVGRFATSATGSHTMGGMFWTLFEKGVDLLVFSAVIFVFGFFSFKAEGQSKKRSWICAISLVLALLYFLLIEFSPNEWYNIRLHYFISSLTMVLALVYLFLSIKANDRQPSLIVMSFLLLGIVVPLGSDTGWLKLFPMYLCFLPYVLTKSSALGIVNKKMHLLFVVLTLFAAVTYLVNPIGGIPLKKARFLGPYPYNNTFVSQSTRRVFEQFRDDYAEYGCGENCIATGIGCHTFNMITSCPLFVQDFQCDIEDEEFVNSLCLYIDEENPVVFLMLCDKYYHENKSKVELENRIEKMGYGSINRENFGYMIYLPKTKN